jgi:hypothetical protein
MMVYMTTKTTESIFTRQPTSFLIQSPGGFYYVSAGNWAPDPQWAFECETREDAERLGALTGLETRVVPRVIALAIANGEEVE